jgi:signal peptidase I
MSPTVLLANPAVRLAGLRVHGSRPLLARPVAAVQPRGRFRWGRLLAGVLLGCVLLGLAFLRTWPPLATVMSGSMAPTINTGDMVLLKRLGRPPRVGEIVSVSVPDQARTRFGYPPVVIHRIVKIDARGSVTTQGDAYDHTDPFTVPVSALTTKVVGRVPAAGRLIAFLGSTLGMLWLVGGGALLLGMPLLDRYRDGQRREVDERGGLQSALEAVTAELARMREERDLQLDATHEAAEVKQQLRLVSTAFSQHLEQLPAVIERAIADAFAAAAPPAPPPPPVPAPAPRTTLLPGPIFAPRPKLAPALPVPAPNPAPPAVPAPAPNLFARRFVAASQYTPPPTPDLLAALDPSLEPVRTPVPWDAPPANPAGGERPVERTLAPSH